MFKNIFWVRQLCLAGRTENRPCPTPPSTRHETRTRIIQSARRLFNRNGFADVTIDEIMGEAGLTRGGFYKHFAAKEDLYQAAVLQFICNDMPEPWQREHVDPDARGTALARMIVDAYLSQRALRRPRRLLPDDRAALRRVARQRRREGGLPPGAGHDGAARSRRTCRRRARCRRASGRWRSAATVVGGMVLARALDDPRPVATSSATAHVAT